MEKINSMDRQEVGTIVKHRLTGERLMIIKNEYESGGYCYDCRRPDYSTITNLKWYELELVYDAEKTIEKLTEKLEKFLKENA